MSDQPAAAQHKVNDLDSEFSHLKNRVSWMAQDVRQALSPRELLTSAGPRRWYTGAGIAVLVWGLNSAPSLFNQHRAGGETFGYLLISALMLIGFMVIPPLSWGRSETFKVAALAVLLVLGGVSLIFSGPSGGWFATFITVCAAMQQYRGRNTIWILISIVVLIVISQLVMGTSFEDALSMAAVAGSIGAMMMAFSRQIQALRILRTTQQELADVAVKEERNRVARDMHDILGHSLTVIAVKAELAGKLLEAAPERAAAEIHDVEELARGALVDVRATVGGYRSVNILSELANARAALTAVGIEAELPGAADEVPAKYRELFGWALREGVTNIVRHSSANRAIVTMSDSFIQIDDDGVGLSQPSATQTANGLSGLRERVEAQQASLSMGRSGLGEHGGFRLRIDL
ncbi:sensor histidine kinase [Psychromicrobium sp. YIM B11713]|uniref:sensor histidine kinase n=1 Tax=Psychromicrobium sp. YIM B11713 TaxID=3145233 RepID=UPI00374E2A0B